MGDLEEGVKKIRAEGFVSAEFLPQDIHSKMYKLSKRLRRYLIIPPEIKEYDLECYDVWVKYLSELEVDIVDGKRNLSTVFPF